MVAVPCIKYGLRMHGNGVGLVEGRLRMVSLPGGKLLEVDSPPEGPVLLSADGTKCPGFPGGLAQGLPGGRPCSSPP